MFLRQKTPYLKIGLKLNINVDFIDFIHESIK